MPRFLFLAALLMLSAPVVMADSMPGSSTLSCNYEFKRPATEGVAEIEVKDGRIQKISFGNFFYGAEGKLGYTCEIEGARGDGETRWVDKKGRTIVELPTPESMGPKT